MIGVKSLIVPTVLTSFYETWRASSPGIVALQDKRDTPPERLLQAIWHHQRIRREDLRLGDGRMLRVLHPGFWNHGAGPDFRDAVLQIGDDAAFSCDIEVDITTAGWHAHKHDQNPNFAHVRLHVVWEGESTGDIATLSLKPFLDAPVAELGLWLATETARGFPDDLLGKCASPLRDLSTKQIEQLLDEAALIRLQRKAGDLQARARQAGWEQALWEGLLRALGYKQNIWPMQRLAELRSRVCQEPDLPLLHTQARLLGISGLLPGDPACEPSASSAYVRRLWDHWWRERSAFEDCRLPRAVWRFHGLRPANHPQRRLALAAHWWRDPALVQRLEKWFLGPHAQTDLLHSLLRALQAPRDDFWSWHWTLRSKRMSAAQPLLGPARVTDIAMNALLPWFWIRAREGGNAALQTKAEELYFSWPRAEDNAVLRLARNRLLGGRSSERLPTAAQQQGLLQVVRDFCEHATALCTECRFPDLVRNWHMTSED